ncbi:hypothetical protein CDL15_Pgr000949 [Punica granatum]|nr:hypothetical protein CDL15_Pgr000949 [Punica granatum]
MAALPSDSRFTYAAADSAPVSRPPFDLDEVLAPTVHYSSGSQCHEEASLRLQPDWRPFVLAFPAVDPGGANQCTVCMEGFRSSDECGRRIPCGHVYHADCITTWLSLYDSCPLCRLKVSLERTNGDK